MEMKALQILLLNGLTDASTHRLTATASGLAEYEGIRIQSNERVNRAALLVRRAVEYHTNWLRYMEHVLPRDCRDANFCRDKYLWANFPCLCDEFGVHREVYQGCWHDDLDLAEIRTYECSHIELCTTCERNRRREDIVWGDNSWSTCVGCN